MQRSRRSSRFGVVGLACLCLCLAGLLAAPLVAGASTPALVLEADSYEPDNVAASASVISVAETQSRTLFPRGDIDWVSFDAVAGESYDFRTVLDGDLDTDTYLYLYDSDATTIIDSNDDSPSFPFSRITWTADATKTVYLKVKHFDTRGVGAYALRVREAQLSIHGTVTDEDTGDPLEWAYAAVYAHDGEEWVVEDWTGTDEDGHYEFWSLADGTYRLGFFAEGAEDAPYRTEYYDDQPSVEEGADIVVSDGVAPGTYNAALEIMEPSIQGTVVDDDWGDPIPGIAVSAYSWDGDLGVWHEAAWGWTDYYGDYTVYGLEGGEWKVGFEMLWPDFEDEFWTPEFYNDQASVDDGEWVETVDGQVTTGIDASLAAAPPAITGNVTDGNSGDPLAGIEVLAYAYDEDMGEWYGMWGVHTDSAGDYALMLGPGDYKIGFTDWDPEDGLYQSEYFDDQLYLKDAELLEIEIGSTRSDIDAELDIAVPSITGTVTNESDEPIPGISIEVYDYFEDVPGWYSMSWSVTDDQGRYEVYGCADGDHRVRFVDWDPSDGFYADEYYDNVELLEDATTIETAMLTTTTDINAVLREGVASVTGQVTDEDTNEAIEGVFVSALQYDAEWEGWWDTSWDESGQDGEYALYNAGTGERVVMFWDWTHTYRSEYWNGQPQVESADIVDVARGVTIEDIDASLILAEPSITGTVTDAETGDPVAGVSVMAWVADDEGWSSEWMATTGENGEYGLFDLSEGAYYVGFAEEMMGGGSYLPEYYDDQPDIESADPVLVVNGATTDGIDAALEPTYEEAAISGRVYNQVTMEPIGLGWVTLYRQGWRGRWEEVNGTMPRADGTYGFFWVEPGQYKVGFHGEGIYIDEYWNNKSSVAEGDWVTFDDDYTPVTGIDAGLVPFDVPADPVPPTVTDDAKDYYLGSALITLSAEDNWAGVDTITYVLDGAGQLASTQNPTEVSTSVVGMHTLTYWASDKEGNVSEHVTRKFRVAAGAETQRLYDMSRYSTALKMAREAFDPEGNKSWPDVGHIVIASGEDRAAADPLSAAGLCWAYDAPLFLVKTDSVPSEVCAAVREIAAANGPVVVHIVGGPASVPDARFNDLAKAVGAGKLTRDRLMSDGNRYDLAVKVAKEMQRVSGEAPEVVLVANGADPAKFFDALALSPIAASEGFPILLVSADTVPGATASYFQASRPAVVGGPQPPRVIVGGGAKTVSERVRIFVRGERWSGADRYSTATTIADKAVGEGWLDYQCVGIAAQLPDALTGGSVVGRMNGPLVLTDGKSLSAATGNWLFKNRAAVRDCYVFGGEKSVTANVRKQIEAKLR